jgi:hypothetical protein
MTPSSEMRDAARAPEVSLVSHLGCWRAPAEWTLACHLRRSFSRPTLETFLLLAAGSRAPLLNREADTLGGGCEGAPNARICSAVAALSPKRIVLEDCSVLTINPKWKKARVFKTTCIIPPARASLNFSHDLHSLSRPIACTCVRSHTSRCCSCFSTKFLTPTPRRL